mmetsp:Transcript_1624/g.4465  ORF Transcript_1624/g.4465 Transcript_1624/m.4465 type:complete len:223 (+) Transcript_1624:812-1480(+)
MAPYHFRSLSCKRASHFRAGPAINGACAVRTCLVGAIGVLQASGTEEDDLDHGEVLHLHNLRRLSFDCQLHLVPHLLHNPPLHVVHCCQCLSNLDCLGHRLEVLCVLLGCLLVLRHCRVHRNLDMLIRRRRRAHLLLPTVCNLHGLRIIRHHHVQGAVILFPEAHPLLATHLVPAHGIHTVANKEGTVCWLKCLPLLRFRINVIIRPEQLNNPSLRAPGSTL